MLVDENTVSAADLFSTFKVSRRGLIVGFTPSAGAKRTVSGGGYSAGIAASCKASFTF
ncbi:MAG: hypothetical protein U0528_20260 [Anaerolineae bacterium]